MKHSVVAKKDLNNEYRIDAEYFAPEILKAYKSISKHKYDILNNIACVIHPTEIERTYSNLGIEILLAQNVKSNKLCFDSRLYMPEQNKKALANNLLNYNDVLITRTGANFGQTASYKLKKEIYACADLLIVKCKNVLGGYLSTFLNTKYGRLMLNRGVYGAAQPHISALYIKELKIPRFDNNFEELIDSLLNESYNYQYIIDKKYDETYKFLIKSLGITTWKPLHKISYIKNFSDVNSVNRCDAEYFQPKYDEIIEKIKSNSNGWNKLSDIIKTIKKGIEVGSEEYCEHGIPFVRVSNLSQHGINNNNLQYISEKYYNSIADIYQPKKGEILLSKDGTPGIAHYLNKVPSKMIPSGGILRLSLNSNEYLPEYITFILNSIVVQMQVERVSSGALIKHWLVDEIQNTLIPKLEMNKQIEIVERLNKATKLQERSKQLLKIAKRGVEVAIEKNEKIATSWVNEQLSA